MNNASPVYVQIDAAKEMTRFYISGVGNTDTYQLGDLTHRFLELDLSGHETARKEVLRMVRDESVMESVRMSAQLETLDEARSLVARAFTFLGVVYGKPEGSNEWPVRRPVSYRTRRGEERSFILEGTHFPDFPFFHAFDTARFDDPWADAETLLEGGAALQKQQANLALAVDAALDVDYAETMAGYSSSKRYEIARANELFVLPVQESQLAYGFFPKTQAMPFPPLFSGENVLLWRRTQKTIADLTAKEIEDFHRLYDVLDCESVMGYSATMQVGLAVLELMALLKLDRKVRRCASCGRRFDFRPNKPSRYCDLEPLGGRMTCREIAAARNHKAKTQSDPLLDAHAHARDRFYSLMKKTGMTDEDKKRLNLRIRYAGLLRDEARDGKKPAHDVIAELNKMGYAKAERNQHGVRKEDR